MPISRKSAFLFMRAKGCNQKANKLSFGHCADAQGAFVLIGLKEFKSFCSFALRGLCDKMCLWIAISILLNLSPALSLSRGAMGLHGSPEAPALSLGENSLPSQLEEVDALLSAKEFKRAIDILLGIAEGGSSTFRRNKILHASVYLRLGWAYIAIDDDKNSLKYFKLGLALMRGESGLPGFREIYRDAIIGTSLAYLNLGEYANAEEILKAGASNFLDGEHSSQLYQARMLESLASAYFGQEKYDQAIDSINQSLIIRLGEHPRDSGRIALSYRIAAFCYKLKGDLGASSSYYSKAVNELRRGGRQDLEQLGLAMLEAGKAYLLRGNFKEAEASMSGILQIYSKIKDLKKRKDIAENLTLYPKSLILLGRPWDAEGILEKVYEIQSSLLGPSSKHAIETGLLLVIARLELHKYDQAIRGHQALEEVASSRYGADSKVVEEIRIIGSIASISRVIGGQVYTGGVQALLDDQLLVHETNLRSFLAKSESGLAKQSQAQKDLIGAIAFHLGEARLLRNDFYSAIRYFKKSLTAIADSESADRLRSSALKGLGVSFLYSRQFSEAKAFIDQSLDIDANTIGLDSISGLNGLALAMASSYYTNSTDQYMSYSFRYLQAATKLLSRRVSIPVDADRDLQRLISQRIDTLFDGGDALVDYQNRYALSLRLSLHGRMQDVSRIRQRMSNRDPGLSAIQEDIWSATNQITHSSLASDVKQKLAKNRLENERKLYALYPELDLQVYRGEDIARALPQRSILIEFLRYYPWAINDGIMFEDGKIGGLRSARYKAIILDSRGSVYAVDLHDASKIEEAIFSVVVSMGANQLDANNSIEALSGLIVDPLIPYLIDLDEIFVAPDAELHSVPLVALFYAGLVKNGRHKDSSLRILGSGRDLLSLLEKPSSAGKSIVISAPNYDLALPGPVVGSARSMNEDLLGSTARLLSTKWLPLAGAGFEGAAVADLLDAEHVQGDGATVGTLHAVKSPRIMHVASHGFFLGEEELSSSAGSLMGRQIFDSVNDGSLLDEVLSRSGIVLAGANGTSINARDDGLLTAREAMMLDLDGTELVVLSACATARGELRTGEGVFGLQRALTVAGARSTLLSLWKVDDAATAEFMVRFYKRLKAGEGRADALAAVQDEFRSGNVRGPKGEDWSTPYFWAAWQLVGDWRPVQGL